LIFDNPVFLKENMPFGLPCSNYEKKYYPQITQITQILKKIKSCKLWYNVPV